MKVTINKILSEELPLSASDLRPGDIIKDCSADTMKAKLPILVTYKELVSLIQPEATWYPPSGESLRFSIYPKGTVITLEVE